MRIKEDLTGNRYERLVVQKHLGGRRWLCKCDCGTVKDIDSKHLKSGNTTSCGCRKAETNRELRSLPYGEASFNHLYSSYKRRAKNKNFSFELTKEEFATIVKQDCIYCGAPPRRQHFSKGSATPYVCNGVDRINNDLGYTLENSAPCCGTCNRMKGDMNAGDFINHAQRIVKK